MDPELVGLIAAVEDSFGFAIFEEEAVRLQTVGQLYDHIRSHRLGGSQDDCFRRIAFHKIRRALMWVRQVPRDAIGTSTGVKALIPFHRRHAWRALQKATGLRLPQLRRSGWVMAGAGLAVLAVAVAMPRILGLGLFNGAILVGLLSAYVAGHCLAWLTSPFASEPPPDCATVGALASAMVDRNFPAIGEEAHAHPSDAEAWQALQSIIGEYWGLEARRVTPETDLHQHLLVA
jgi:hypothetical protein